MQFADISARETRIVTTSSKADCFPTTRLESIPQSAGDSVDGIAFIFRLSRGFVPNRGAFKTVTSLKFSGRRKAASPLIIFIY